jgi:Malectin domain
MPSGLQAPVSDPFAEERAALAAILASATFARSPNLAKILTYICESHFLGLADSLKEYSIGMHALGRGADFDPRVSSVVRVEVSRLRKRLTQYYASEGASDPIRVVLPETGYKPHFIERPMETVADAELSPAANPSDKRLPRHRGWITFGLAAVLIVGAAIALLLFNKGRPETTSRTALRTSEAAADSAGPLGSAAILIQPGAQATPYVDRLGRTWGKDRFFTGGSPFNRPVRIYGTVDPALYQSGREGSFSYAIPAPKGLYELHLHFAESFWDYEISESDGSGTRMFDVRLNGKPILSGFDIVSDAGGPKLADERVFTGVSPEADGLVHLEFIGRIGAALLNGIELLPASSIMRPVRIVCGGDSYVDRKGNLWGSDRLFLGGRMLEHVVLTTGTDDPGLYSGEHWGHFTYRVPVAPGTYTVRLCFAERHYGRSNLEGGIGSRLFNVYCNGVALLKNFDIISDAGDENRAVDKTFHGVTPNPQGKIVILFEPGNTYATVNAIEVRAEQ